MRGERIMLVSINIDKDLLDKQIELLLDHVYDDKETELWGIVEMLENIKDQIDPP
jgi:hypothetical protein